MNWIAVYFVGVIVAAFFIGCLDDSEEDRDEIPVAALAFLWPVTVPIYLVLVLHSLGHKLRATRREK